MSFEQPLSLPLLQTSVPRASRSLCCNLWLYCLESHQLSVYLRFYGFCFGRSLLRFIGEWFVPSWIILRKWTRLQLYESRLHSQTRSPVSRQKLLSSIIALQQVINGAVFFRWLSAYDLTLIVDINQWRSCERDTAYVCLTHRSFPWT